jgi:hypothetical protein
VVKAVLLPRSRGSLECEGEVPFTRDPLEVTDWISFPCPVEVSSRHSHVPVFRADLAVKALPTFCIERLSRQRSYAYHARPEKSIEDNSHDRTLTGSGYLRSRRERMGRGAGQKHREVSSIPTCRSARRFTRITPVCKEAQQRWLVSIKNYEPIHGDIPSSAGETPRRDTPSDHTFGTGHSYCRYDRARRGDTGA